MEYLLRKYLIIFFNSARGYIILSVWAISLSAMLWLFKGDFNLLDGGYATLSPFFTLTPIMLILFVPAVTMKLISEEKRSGTIELLKFRPICFFNIILSKYLSACIVLFYALILTLVYVFSLNIMSTTGLDIGETLGGYIGLVFIILAFAAISVFISFITSNQIIAFLLSAFICFICYYGFDLIASLSTSGPTHNFISQLGIHTHYQSLMKGVVDSRDITYYLTFISFFIFLSSIKNVAFKTRSLKIYIFNFLIIIIFIYLISYFFFFRIDLTAEKRYTISQQTKELIGELEKPLEAILYLNGDLNPDFDRLRTSTVNMLEEFSIYSNTGISLTNINPTQAINEENRIQNYKQLENRGIKGITVNEQNREGQFSSKLLFPWLELVYDGDTLPVELLKRNINLNSRQRLNSSIEELEYSLVDILQLLLVKEPLNIAFIEGHGEWNEAYVHEATELLSKYYNIDRGIICGNPEELFPYKALIIASPQKYFTESEKFALDQYLMNGGNLFFLIDGIQISEEDFLASGESVTLKLDLNLDDMLFNYGIRINPVIVQDMNCTSIRLATSNPGTKENYITVPWYFSPLLEPSREHIITSNLSPLKSEYVSTISWVGTDSLTTKTVLLTSSTYAHQLPVPEKVSLRYVEMPASRDYFTEQNLPVGGLIEGTFSSLFKYRIIPEGAILPEGISKIDESKIARILVIASSSVIRNEWRGRGVETQPLPLGYDPITHEQLGNAEFIVNAVNYLTGNQQWLSLRTRTIQLRLLNKEEVTDNLLKWQLINLFTPLIILLFSALLIIQWRKRLYSD